MIVDNTFASPVLCRPLEHGADLVVESATKYLSGHSDVLAGVVVGSRARIATIRDLHVETGGTLAPFSAFLVLRGIPTLALRMERHAATAARLAAFLETPRGARVLYPMLPSHPHTPSRPASSRPAAGCSPGPGRRRDGARAFVDALRIPERTASLGSIHTIVVHPPSTTHRQLSAAELAEAGIAPGLVRVSVGLEDADDLLADMAQALEAAGGHEGPAAGTARPATAACMSPPARLDDLRPPRSGGLPPPDLRALRRRPDHRDRLVGVVGIIVPQLPGAFRSPADFAELAILGPAWRPLGAPVTDIFERSASSGSSRLVVTAMLALLAVSIVVCTLTARRVSGAPPAMSAWCSRTASSPGPPDRAVIRDGLRADDVHAGLRRSGFRVREEEGPGGARFLYGDRNQNAKLFTLLTHAGLVGFILAAAITSRFGFESGILLPEGQALPVESIGSSGLVSVKSLAFTAPRDADGRFTDFTTDPRSTATGGDRPQGESG
jgi:hypothetical protein